MQQRKEELEGAKLESAELQQEAHELSYKVTHLKQGKIQSEELFATM